MSTYTPSLGLELITPGSQAGLWGNTTNNSLNLIDQAVTGVTPVSFASASGSTYTLTDYNGAEDEARSAVLNVTGTAIGANTIIIPNKQKTYFVRNSTGQDITIQTVLGTTPCTVGAGYNLPVFCDGNNNVFLAILAPGAGTLTVTGGGTGATTFGSGGFIKSSGGTNALTAASAVALGSEVSGTLPVANGGTGAVSLTSGAILIGNGTGTVASLSGGVAGYVATWNGTTWVSQAPTAAGVTSFAGGTTGLTPSLAATGAITLGGTLNTTNGGTGLTSFTTNGALYATSSSVITSGTLPIASGGTGATSAASALTNLGGASTSGTNTWSGSNTFQTRTTFNAAGGVGTPTILVQPQSDTHGIEVTYSAKTSSLGPTAVQVGYSGQGVFSSASGSISLFEASGAWNLSGSNCEWTGAGNAYKVGGGSWAASSDSRLKENATPLTGALEKIAALKPVTYSWKYATNEPTVGFIAQEVEQIIPSAVGRVSPTEEQKQFVTDDVYSLGWQNDIFAYLVGAIQELKAEVDALKAAK